MLNQIDLIVRDMDATVAFYRQLGLEIDADAGGVHVEVRFSNGMLLEFDSTAFVTQWDAGWNGSTGGSAVLGFAVPSRAAVDALYADLTAAGYRGRQRPYDAFLGRAVRHRGRPGRQRRWPHEPCRERPKILATKSPTRRLIVDARGT